jgi:hypothetical protein
MWALADIDLHPQGPTKQLAVTQVRGYCFATAHRRPQPLRYCCSGEANVSRKPENITPNF